MATKVSERVRVQIDVENFHKCKGNVLTKNLDSEIVKLKVNIYPNPSNTKDLKVNVYGKSSTRGEYFIKMSLMVIAKSKKKILVGEDELKLAANIIWEKIASFDIQEDLNENHRYVLGNRSVLTLLLTAGVIDLGLLMGERTASTGTVKILSDMENLMGNQDLCDVILCSEDCEFHVHKCLICSRSSVFAAMIEKDMLKQHTNTVLVVDTTALALKEIIYYFYTGKVTTVNLTVLLQVYKAAGKYSLCDLKNKVASLLSTNLEQCCHVECRFNCLLTHRP